MTKLNARVRTGYVFEEKGKWFARITFTDEDGKRCNIRRIVESKTEAKELLKKLVWQIENNGIKAVESWQINARQQFRL